MDQTHQTRIAQLKSLLGALPSSFPTSTINLDTFRSNPGDVNDYGYTGAVNRAFETTFGWKSRSRLSRLTGHGPGLSAVVSCFGES
jgi:hypothetical protein